MRSGGGRKRPERADPDRPSEVERGQVAVPAARPFDGLAPAVPVRGAAPVRSPGRASTWRRCRPTSPTCRRPGRRGTPAPSAVASATGATSTGFCVASASAWTNTELRGHAAVDPQRVERQVAVELGRLDQVGASLGDALEHRPHDVRRGGAAGQARAACRGRRSPTGACPARAAPARRRRRRRCRPTRRSSPRTRRRG